MITRRHFLTDTATGLAAAAGALRLAADPLGLPIGFQSYSVRQMIESDFEGILKRLAGVGYRTVELCSPPGYAKSGFGSLLNLKASDLRDKIRSTGLTCESCHYGAEEIRDHLDERIAYARQLGLKQMILAHPGIKPNAGMDEWKRVSEWLNKAGEKTRKAGIQLGYHNHDVEFTKIDGVLIYDEFMRMLDPKLVKMQFQVAVIRLGFEPAEFLAKYPGRVVSMHLSDWSDTEKRMVPIGKGVLDWKKIFAAAKTAGVKNYFVEMNLDLLEASYPYLHSLKA